MLVARSLWWLLARPESAAHNQEVDMIGELNKAREPASLTKVADAARWRIKHALRDTRAELGQFLTPAPIADFMAGMFHTKRALIRVLDPGAGVGTLTAALVEALLRRKCPPDTISATCYEIDPRLFGQLEGTMQSCRDHCARLGVRFAFDIRRGDFVTAATGSRGALFGNHEESYECVVLNPPYRKINSHSDTRLQLRSAGIETTNLYSAFMLLSAKLLSPSGEFVSISPRSFCNGPYFRQFRRQFLQLLDLQHVHVFESRADTFKDDGVLQENVIIYGIARAARKSDVKVSIADQRGRYLARSVPADQIVRPDDPEAIIHVISGPDDAKIAQRMLQLKGSLGALGLSVSTGRVVDFRARRYLRAEHRPDCAPLIYPAHFRAGRILWPKPNSRKPNAIVANDATADLLLPSGFYVLTKRFSAKEEPRRVVAAVYDPGKSASRQVAFDNKTNFFHVRGRGIDERLAYGLAVFLNSSTVDDYFRLFSGHTQVNAADLRRLPYPTIEQLIGLADAGGELQDQATIDAAVARLF